MSDATKFAKEKLMGSAGTNRHDAPEASERDTTPQLLEMHRKLIMAAENPIVFSPPMISYDGKPIFGRGIIGVIQGRAGSHKSRLAETFCALLLATHKSTIDFLGFVKERFDKGYFVGYIDTERNTQEHLPDMIQRIRQHSGHEKLENDTRFFPTSIKKIPRKERLQAVKDWITYIRGEMVERRVEDWGLFVVLDVVTDCVASFNSESETLALFDYLGNLCEDHGVTFLLVIHENPGSEKARGHVGTEALNKADAQLQISYEAGGDGEDSDLIKIRFLKTRNAERPKPLYLQYSKEVCGLVAADQDTISEHVKSRAKNNDLEPLTDTLQNLFDKDDKVSPTGYNKRTQGRFWMDKQNHCSK
jgi:hypothetical protein